VAFGSGSSNVARADVEFRAETGKFEADVAVAKRIYTEAVGGMSDASLRMSVAQEKLDRAISKFGPESLQARSAAVAYRKELNATQEQADHTRRSVHASNNEMLRAGRGALAASGAFKGLGNALFFASSSFAGAFGLIYALRSTIKEAAHAQVVMAQLSKAVGNAGISWGDHRKAILAALEAQSKLSAFDDEELKASFSSLIVRTKDVNEALKLNAVAADVARARHTSLQQAVTLVTRASLGQVGSLRRLGLDVERVTAAQDKLRAAGVKVTFAQREQAKAADVAATRLSVVSLLQTKFAGQAAQFAGTAEGAQERFNKVLNDTKEIIGIGLLPTITNLLTQFSEYLDKLNKSGDLQRKMNVLLRDGGIAAHIVAETFKEIKDILDPLVRALGGTEQAVKDFLLVMAAYKLAKIAGAIKGMAVAFGFVGPAATKAAAETVIAENAIGTGALAQIPKVAALRAELALLGGVSLGAAAATAGVIVAGIVGGVAVAKGLSELDELITDQTATEKKNANRIVTVWRKYGGAWLRTAYDNSTPRMKKIIEQRLRAVGDREALRILGFKNLPSVLGPPAPPPAATTDTGGSTTTSGGTTKRTEADIQLDLSRAQARGDVAGQARADRELLALYRAQAANLERRKNLTLLQKQKLTQLYGQIEGVQSELDSIAADASRKDQERARASEQARAKRLAAHKQTLDTREQRLQNALLHAAATAGIEDDRKAVQALIAFYKAAAHDAELTAKERAQYENKRLKVGATARAARGAAELKRLDLREQRLRNAADRAELTDTLADDRKTLQALIAFYRAEVENEKLSASARAAAEKKRIAARKRLKDVNKQGGADGSGGLTMADFRRESFEFLQSLHGVTNTYGSNIDQSKDAGWALHTQGHLAQRERREQTMSMKTIASRLGHQDARYIAAATDVVMDGVGAI